MTCDPTNLSSKNEYAGIYKITCTSNGRVYIGSSTRLYKRKLDHFSYMRAGTHCNSHLQNCYNKYGEENLVFEVMVILPADDRKFLYETEQKFIDSYKPELNICQLVGQPTPLYRPVAQYDLKGKLVASYPSLTCAADEMGVTIQAIYNAITGKSRMAVEHLWRYVDGDVLAEIEPIDLQPGRGIAEGSKWLAFWELGEYVLYQWSTSGELVGTWDSLDKILEAFPDMRSAHFREHIHGRTTSCHGFVWSKDEVFPGYVKRGTYKSKPVSLVKDDETKVFQSYTEASKFFGVTSGAVSTSIKRKGNFKGWALSPVQPTPVALPT